MNNFVHFMNFIEGRLGAGIKCVKNKINSNSKTQLEWYFFQVLVKYTEGTTESPFWGRSSVAGSLYYEPEADEI